ncbi:PQQ-binding-like beta-propeller repeat protein [Planctomycetota bacterium]
MELRRMMKSYVHVLILGLGTLAIICTTAHAADWPNYRGPNYDGISTETDWSASWPESGPKVLWKASLGIGFASMSVSNGKVYAMGNIDDTDYLYCFDAATGKEIWKKSYPCPLYSKMHEGGPCATPTVEGDAVYILSKDGDAIRYKAATGDVVWHKKLNKDLGLKHPTWHFSSSPLLAGDLVIYNAGTYGIALNKTDGSTVWQNGKSASGYTTGVPYTIGGQKAVVMAVCKELVSLNPVTGKVMWKLPWKTSYDINAADAIVSGDTIFISSGYKKGCALVKINGSDVTKVWQNKNMQNMINCSVLWEGHIYGFDGQVGGGGKLTCLDLATGEKKWSQGGMGTGSLMLADGKLIILGEKGKLVIAEASTEGFNELASAEILTGKCWTVPVLANGRIYARNAAGQLVCVDVSG